MSSQLMHKAGTGDSTSTRRARESLRLMPQELAVAFHAKRVSLSTAQEICKIPVQRLRERVTLHVLAGVQRWPASPGELKERGTPLSFRQTKKLIQDHVMRELKGAPFDTCDPDLVERAGSCETCPKRAGNLKENDPDTLWAESRADICTDPGCYREKKRAAALAKCTALGVSGLHIVQTHHDYGDDTLKEI